jgi:spermidine synthase
MAALSLANAAWALAPRADRASAAGGDHAPATGATRALARALRFVVAASGIVVLIGALFFWRPAPLIGEASENREVLFYKEGLVATTMVYRDRNDTRRQSMSVDRIKIGDSYSDVDMKQQALAHFPFLLLPNRPPATVLSTGLGTGILIGECARHPSVAQLECVEIEPSVIEGARYFDEFNDHVLDNPRVRVICDDGANYLRRTRTTYDAIICDAKSRTSHSGNSLFLSVDYYELCLAHLAPDGLMIQWIPLNLPTAELPIVLRTFMRVFPYSYVWADPPGSFFLVGLRQPLVLDVAHIQRVLDAPETAHLRRYGWDNAYGIISQLDGDRESLAGWLGAGRTVNRLERPVLEFYSPQAFAMPEPLRVAANLTSLATERTNPPPTATLIGADPAKIARHDAATIKFIEAEALLQTGDVLRVNPAFALLDEGLALAPEHGRLNYTAGTNFFARANELGSQGDLEGAMAMLRRAVTAQPDFAEGHFNLGNALAARRQFDEAIVHYRKVVELMPDFPGGHFNLANSLAATGQYAEAAGHFRRTLELKPDMAPARERLQRVMMLQQQQPPGGPGR